MKFDIRYDSEDMTIIDIPTSSTTDYSILSKLLSKNIAPDKIEVLGLLIQLEPKDRTSFIKVRKTVISNSSDSPYHKLDDKLASFDLNAISKVMAPDILLNCEIE